MGGDGGRDLVGWELLAPTREVFKPQLFQLPLQGGRFEPLLDAKPMLGFVTHAEGSRKIASMRGTSAGAMSISDISPGSNQSTLSCTAILDTPLATRVAKAINSMLPRS